MIMLGTIVNCLAIILGSLIGLMVKGGIPEKISNTIMQGLSLSIIFIGISGLIKGSNVLLILISMLLGAVIGELIDIEELFQKLGKKVETKIKGRGENLAEGFVTASLLFCVGAMAVIGSLNSGLENNHTLLFTKSILDGITSIIFASSLGIGVIFSAGTVFVYQGIITLAASLLKAILITSVISDMTAVGSLLIMALGFNTLGITKIKVANLLPAVFIPILYQIALNIMGFVSK